VGWVVQAAGVIPLFQFVFNGGIPGVYLGTSLLAIGLGLTYGPAAVWFAEAFPASIRYSGISISYALGGVIGGAFAPTIAQILLQTFGTPWAIVVYLLVMTALGLFASITLRDRSNIPLDHDLERTGQWKLWEPTP